MDPKRASQANLAELAAQDEANRIHRYARAWQAYDGEGPLPFGDEDGQAQDNVRLDYPRLIVDKGVSFLAGKGGVEFQLDPPTDAALEASDEEPDPEDGEAPPEPEEDPREEARAELDAAWPEEERHTDFHKLAVNGGVCGQFWLRLHESGRVSVLDPSTVTVVWDEDDVDTVKRYLIEWTTVNEAGMGVARRKRIEPDNPEEPTAWTIFDEEHDDDDGRWVQIDETPWGHSYAPLVGGQNLPQPNTFYGASDLEPAILDLIEQLQSVASDMRRIVRLHGHPIPVVTGEEAHRLQEIDVAIGELLAIPNKEAKLGQLAIAELTSALALYKELKAALFEAVRIPRVALGDTTNAGPTAGVALQVEYEPLLEKTQTKRLTYGSVLRKAAERVLDLRGLSGWRVTLGWPQLLPTDEKTEAETSEADLRMGVVSKQTIAEKRGYDWSVEEERLREQRDADGESLAAAFDGGRVGE